MAPTKTPNAPRGTIHGFSSSNIVRFTIRASPLPQTILDFVLQNVSILKKLQNERRAKDSAETQDGESVEGQEVEGHEDHGDVVRKPSVGPEQFWNALQDVCKNAGGEWTDVTERIWAFGPQQAGGCLLIDSRKSETHFSSAAPLFRTLSPLDS